MKHRLFLATAAVFLAAQAAPAEGVPMQGKPPQECVKVHLPGAPALEFAVIPLQIGDNPFAARECWFGARDQTTFREPLVRGLVSGSFVLPIAGNKDWCMMLGKTEVTTAQWNAVMGLPAPAAEDADYPISRISAGDIGVFIEKANQLLRRDDAASVIECPYGIGVPGAFLRLPTENEWEFAARGGGAVDSTTFSKPTPYAGDLNRHEWHFSQNSSKGKVRRVALLDPNPLGICDMLGNVSELVSGCYQAELIQGRVGGNVARGGCFRSEASEIRSSTRFEIPASNDDGSPYRSSTVGFRLAIGSLIIAGRGTTDALESSWRSYLGSRVQTSGAISPTASVAQASGRELGEIERLAKTLALETANRPVEADPANEALALIEAQTASVRGRLEKAEKYFSTAAVRLASVTSTDSVSIVAKIRLFEDNAKTEGLAGSGIHVIQLNRLKKRLTEAESVVEDSCVMLAEVSEASVKSAFESHIDQIRRRASVEIDAMTKAALMRQVVVTEAVRDAALAYLVHRHLDLVNWRDVVNRLGSEFYEQSQKN